MREKIIYILAFAFTFIIVTGAIIYLNSICNNIFVFDFSPVKTNTLVQTPQNEITNNPQKDSTASLVAAIDSLKQQQNPKSDSTSISLSDTNAVKNLSEKLEDKKLVVNTPVLEQSISNDLKLSDKKNAKKDSTYKVWVKNAAQLYTSMDTKKAAKIIQGYSDNIARDILLTMKKKKAAEIIAEFKPDLATRIISAQQ